MADLTPKQGAFIAAYLETLNASEAARRAGYSEKTAYSIGEELLRKPEISDAIAKARKEHAERNQINADRVLIELARIAFADVGDVLNPDGSPKPLDQIDESARRAIADVDPSKRVKLHDKTRALGLLARHLGLLQDKLTLRGDAENPLKAILMAVQGTSLPAVEIVREGD